MPDALPTAPPIDLRSRSVACAIVLVAAAVCLWPAVFRSKQEQMLQQAADALLDRRFDEAEELAGLVLATDSESAQALLIAGEAATGAHRPQAALGYFTRVPDDGGMSSVLGLAGQAERLIRLGRAAEAERVLRRLLELAPDRLAAHDQLVYLLETQARGWEALPSLARLIQNGQFSGDHLLMTGSTEWMYLRDSRFVDECRKAVPADALPLMVAARQALRENRYAEAVTQLEHIVADHPRLFEAQARLGRAFVERGEHEKYLHWDRALPPEASGHPEIWVTRGFFAEGRGERRVAIRCFGEAVRLHPDHVTACYRLSQLLAAEGLAQNATLFGLRAQRLARLESLLNEVRSEFALPMVHEVVETLSDLGRNWEAAGWSHLALRVDPALPWALRRLRAFRATTAKFVLTPDEANPARRIDLSRYPLPQPPGMRQSDQPSQLAAGRSSDIRFENSADEAGLDFRYFNGADPASGRAYMFEFSGGGAAVLDYDGDAWPDLYLTQGCPWPVGERSHGFRDLLYRNLGNGRFAEVPAGAAAADAGFGQGAAPGDFNNDGFPDLYVANIGANRLFVNNGDGTFSDVTAQSATGGGDRWTTSSVLADFNGDGAPDIYAVNYLAAPEVFEKVCEDGGRPVQCAPTMFAAEQDRLFLNNGDGTFRDATETSGIVAPDGKGLGVVAADFDDSGRLSLFVANDTTANFFFQNRVPSPRVTTRGLQDGPLFEEQALLSGLALDGHGHAQACMGIAVDDADGDGRLDLFVTNFYGESNVLYFQPAAGMFSDETAASGLREPSHFSLGFGTQFLDADLDGWPDLIVTNGHINDFTASGTPYQMRPQFFRNRGRGKFAEVAADELGPYFQHKYLGRALARLDWNRDGLDDACVTHVDAPVALLTNRTSGGGHSLRLRFSARQSARDAIGTTVRIANGGREAVRQLTAGGGFEAANQPQLTIGLGDEPQAERVIVRWPSGTEQEFHDLAAGAEWLVIEGDARPWRLPR